MKELFLHLWKTSRLFQVALVVGALAAVWGLLGRPSGAPAPSQNSDAVFKTPVGNFQASGVSPKDVGDAKDTGTGMLKDGADAFKETTGAVKKVAGVVKDGAGLVGDGLSVIREKIYGPPAADPKVPPLDPVNPKAP